MKKELALHFLATAVLVVVISLLRRYLSLSYWPFWVGGILGTVLPDIDHVIYVYYLRPYELTSQRVINDIQKGNVGAGVDLLSSTRSERTNLIFHTIIFQVFFVVLSFFVVSSSLSLLGKGLVLAFLLHLFVDQILDFRYNGNLSNWLKNFPLELDRTQINVYLLANFVVILIFSFM